jgi:hypothetical protein
MSSMMHEYFYDDDIVSQVPMTKRMPKESAQNKAELAYITSPFYFVSRLLFRHDALSLHDWMRSNLTEQSARLDDLLFATEPCGRFNYIRLAYICLLSEFMHF